MEATILYEVKEGIAKITLHRPTVFNSFNTEMGEQFLIALDKAAADDEVRAVYLIGEGRAFCAGQDLGEVTDPNGPQLADLLQKRYNPIVSKIRQIEKPFVAAVNGVAAGAGANIALVCDVVVAREDASFIQAFSKIGLIPDSGGTFFLPRLIGFQKASALMLLGEKVSATDAERLGMIYKLFSKETFEVESWKIALTLAKLPTKALGYTKRALNQSLANTFDAQLAVEDQLQNAASQTEDYGEGVNAFIEKRTPIFKGR
jgi:2-(1,2-epoxy-1,2-dihydrophenyl)acetyl-CoA isomerase